MIVIRIDSIFSLSLNKYDFKNIFNKQFKNYEFIYLNKSKKIYQNIKKLKNKRVIKLYKAHKYIIKQHIFLKWINKLLNL